MVVTWLWHGYYMVYTWLWYDYYMVVTWLWHGCDMVMTWLWNGFDMVMTWLWHGCDMVMTPGWYSYDMVVTWLWHGCDMVVTRRDFDLWPKYQAVSSCIISTFFLAKQGIFINTVKPPNTGPKISCPPEYRATIISPFLLKYCKTPQYRPPEYRAITSSKLQTKTDRFM